ncbi:centromere protein P isoform X2 [Mirounga leonina]|uniref:centromere protein P isoform X2 n=1 Tax=Mirounga leonina TaxID=9715 RepID=UPI00156BFA3D|nr:centromere protein P isoform X2 [Mirounga leonina]XP_034885163.1 centromere protein P isoform X2 [Mirounga leonina]
MDAQRAEVRALEAEIAALRRACEEPRAAGEDTWRAQKSLREMYQSDSEGGASSKDLRSHLGHLESELLFLSTLTGISVRNYSMKTEDLTNTEKKEKSIMKVLQRHRLSGNCHMITFQLEFQILEIQNKESLSSVITDLNIIMEPTEYSELSEFVSRAEERRDLLMFFRSLHFFVEWCEYRKRTFEHFKLILDNKVGWKVTKSQCLLLLEKEAQSRGLRVPYLQIHDKFTPDDKPHSKSRPHT